MSRSDVSSRRRSSPYASVPTDVGSLGHPRAMAALALAPPLAPPAVTVDLPQALTFEEIYESSFDFVWRNVRRLGVVEAAVDDVVQDVFLVVHRRLADFEGRSSIRTWIFAILFRVVSDWRRTQRRKGGLASLDEIAEHDGWQDEHATCPAGAAERAEAMRLLHALLDQLDDDKRTVFVLVELEQSTAPEIAEMLGIPVNTVYSRLRAARIEFERALARYRSLESERRAT
jgi:RNA polymerase sigma-70 factor, ECF subfamily